MKLAQKILNCFFSAVLLMGLLPAFAFADQSAKSTLVLNVSYSELKCGTPIRFTLNATGGSGNYQYLFNRLDRYGEDGMNYVVDPSRMPGYQKSNTYDFTFYASGRYLVDFYVMDMSSSPLETKRSRLNLNINDPNYSTCEAKADQVAKECLDSGASTDFDKAVWLHDWVIDNCTYDNSLLYCEAEGALARGTGTCEAYHRSYVMLLNRVGIEAGRIEGNGHVWTAVKMDGKWYQVDATWDDIEYSYSPTYPDLRHLHFGLDDKIMGLVHSDHSSPVKGYESDSLDNNYFIKTGQIDRFADVFNDAINENIDKGNFEFNLAIDNPQWPANYKNVIYNLVAYRLSTKDWSLPQNDRISLSASYANDILKIKILKLQASQQMYRLYNPNSGEHFYTANAYERDHLSRVGWDYEGIGWTAPLSSCTPVYRLYSGTDHHYTTNAAEKNMLMNAGWSYEGIGWYSDDQKRVPLYRQFNPNVDPGASRNNSGSHNYTTSYGEHLFLCANGWLGEGISWYGM